MIRIVITTGLAGLFSTADYAVAQLDCSSSDIACTANCQFRRSLALVAKRVASRTERSAIERWRELG
jgi:hypothetical protein